MDKQEVPKHHLEIHKKPVETGKRLALIVAATFVAFTIIFFVLGKFMGGHPAPPAHPAATPSASVSQTVHQGAASAG